MRQLHRALDHLAKTTGTAAITIPPRSIRTASNETDQKVLQILSSTVNIARARL
jgi:hypothetical protein